MARDNPKCQCNDAIEEHECPYEADVNNDPNSACNCCEYCTQECANDI